MPQGEPEISETSYEGFAEAYMSARGPTVGVEQIRAWARLLPPGGRVLDLGCGHG